MLQRIKDVENVKLWYELCHGKIYFMPFANNKDADQPAHLRSLISIFVVRSLDKRLQLLYLEFLDSS